MLYKNVYIWNHKWWIIGLEFEKCKYHWSTRMVWLFKVKPINYFYLQKKNQTRRLKTNWYSSLASYWPKRIKQNPSKRGPGAWVPCKVLPPSSPGWPSNPDPMSTSSWQFRVREKTGGNRANGLAACTTSPRVPPAPRWAPRVLSGQLPQSRCPSLFE